MKFYLALALLFIILHNESAATVSKKVRTGEAGHRRSKHSHHDHLNVYSPPKNGVPNALANEDKAYWFADGQAELEAQLAKQPEIRQAKNVIVFLADGTSMSTFTAARLLKGYRSGSFERETSSWEAFPFTGIIKTYNTNQMVTDSAASSTAYLSGVKGNQGTIGVDVNVPLGDCDAMLIQNYHTQSILRDFQLANRSTGIVTNTRVTHASPAGNYAHTAERHWENDNDMNDDGADSVRCDDIAEQLVTGETGSQIKVILGGGRRGFLPKEVTDEEGDSGERDDNKNLITTWLAYHTATSTPAYVWNRADLLGLDTSATDYLLGLFDSSHMDYFVDYDGSDPTLAEMTSSAIKILQKDPNGFYLFVEGGLIDTAHHLNEASSAIEEAIQFEKAVSEALKLTSSNDTLIIVTADHGQPITINGYLARNGNILGVTDTLSDSGIDDYALNVLMYTNGPGYRDQTNDKRPDPEGEELNDSHYVHPAYAPMIESDHNGEDVVIFANGPHSHLFTGIHENSYIPHALRYASCVGDGLNFCFSR